MRLTRTLRSPDAAAEALHDAYLKLRNDPLVSSVRSPRSYLHRMAMNLAKNRRRHETFLPLADSDLVTNLADDSPDPERVALGRHELARALAALDGLPEKRRAIFLARWRDDQGQAEIAARFNVHLRTVQKELARAERHLRLAIRR